MTSPINSGNRRWWDADAERYHRDHAEYLDTFHWCPEMLSEQEAGLLGDVTGLHVLEIGCGSAPCADWLGRQKPAPRLVVGFDLSRGMLERAPKDTPARLVQADAESLPFAENSFDVAFSAFGALPFVPDVEAVLRGVARVLKPGGRLVASVNHPMRWVFPDDPGPAGLVAGISYFEREYIELAEDGSVAYAEFHRTMGDWVRAFRRAGFEITDLIEPEWPEGLDRTWGQWSPLRGKVFPGTAIFTATRTLVP